MITRLWNQQMAERLSLFRYGNGCSQIQAEKAEELKRFKYSINNNQYNLQKEVGKIWFQQKRVVLQLRVLHKKTAKNLPEKNPENNMLNKMKSRFILSQIISPASSSFSNSLSSFRSSPPTSSNAKFAKSAISSKPHH